jgi:hypothetical protein
MRGERQPQKQTPLVIVGNGLDEAGPRPAAPPPAAEMAQALDLPNLDGRASVMANLPKDLYVEGRIDFEEEEEDSVPGVRFGTPRQADFVRCDPNWGKLLHCLKNPKNGVLYPVTMALLRAHAELAAAAKLYVVRLAVVDDSDELLFWAAPHPSYGTTPGDRVWRQAQTAALTRWTKTWWDGSARHYAHPRRPENFEEPTFPAQDYDNLLQAAVAEDLIWREDHFLAQKLLR